MTKVVHYHTETASSVPSAGNVARGEIALNLPDKKIFTKDHTDTVVELGVGGSTVVAITYDHLLAANDTVNTAISTDITNGDIAFGDVIYVGSHYISTEYTGVPKGGAHYIYTSGAADTSGSEISTNSNHLKLVSPVVTPHHFGITEDGTDESAKLQKFFDYVTTNPEVHCDWSCNVSVSSAVDFTGYNNYVVQGTLRITALAAITTILTIEDASDRIFDSIYIHGTGGATYSGRSCVNGLFLVNCSRAHFNRIEVNRVLRDGINISSVVSGNNNYITIGSVKILDAGCGLGTRGISDTIVSATRFGSSGTTGQTCELVMTAALPANFVVDDFVVVEGKLLRVTAIDGGTKKVTVYPWPDADPPSVMTAYYVFGAGITMLGGDGGGITVGMCDVIGAGIGYFGRALYGSTFETLSTQSCYVGQLYGDDAAANHIGGVVNRGYFEGNDFDLIQGTRTDISVKILNTVALNLAKCHNITAMRYTDASLNESLVYSRLRGLDVYFDRRFQDGFSGAPTETIANNNIAGNSAITLTVGEHRINNRDTCTITLTDDQDYTRLTGDTVCSLTIMGHGTNNEPTGTYTVAVESGYSIDGTSNPSTVTLPAMAGPTKVSFIIAGTEWRTVSNVTQGISVLSTGETGGTKFLREDGDGTCSWQAIAGGGDALVANPLSQFAATTSAQLAGVISDETGSGDLVFATSPALVTPDIGTPSAGVATNLTGTATGLTSGITNALKSATTTVDVSAATAPTTGQVLKATSGTAATWQTISGGTPEGTDILSTGEAGGTKYLREDGDGTSSWQPVTASVAALNDITNVTITANSSGEILKWNGSAWVNNTLAEAGIEPADGTILKDADIGSTVQAYNAALTGTTGTYTTANATTLSTALQVNPALGTPVSGVATNLTGTATGLTSGITNALKSATTTVDVSAATAPTTGQVLKATSGTAATWQNESGGGGNEFADNVFRIQDDGDATKEIAFQASGITTATTRTVTMPDANVDLGALGTTNIADEAVTHAKLAHIATDSILGRTTAATGDVETLTAAQVKTLLAIAVADLTNGGSIATKDFWTGTQVSYDGLTPDANTIYFVE